MRRCDHVRGLTVVEVLVVVFLLAIVVAFFVISSYRWPKGMQPRTSCAANLKALAQACVIYSESNRGFLPSIWQPSDVPAVTSLSHVGDRRALPDGQAPGTTTAPSLPNQSGTRAYYKLLLGGRNAFLQPKQLVCPTAAKSLGHDRAGTEPRPVVDGKERVIYDFDGTKISRDKAEMTEFSYSFMAPLSALESASRPFDESYRQIDHLDPRLALAADRNPYSNSVVVSPQGYGEYQFNPRAPTKPPPPPGDQAAFDAAAKVRDRRLNSRNHGGDGQNVSFVDGHAKWFNNAWVGADEDCIWTFSELATDADGKTRVRDRVPLQGADYGRMRPNPAVHTDSLLLP